jgi:hypothetical protein
MPILTKLQPQRSDPLSPTVILFHALKSQSIDLTKPRHRAVPCNTPPTVLGLIFIEKERFLAYNALI